MKKEKDTASQSRHLEELLRPNAGLGYDHAALGAHMLAVEAFAVAEFEFRRAIWLNPYEPRFKLHLAWSLFRQKRYAEARTELAQVPPDCMPESAAALRRLLDVNRDGTGGEPLKAV